jgi:hypothetical protein
LLNMKVVHKDLQALGVDHESVKKFLKYKEADDKVGDDPYMSSTAEKTARTKAYRQLHKDLTAKTKNPNVAINAMHKIHDYKGKEAMYESMMSFKSFLEINELSNVTLASYKKKAGEQATAADKAGDFKKGNKRFSGITKATKKQFANPVKEDFDICEAAESGLAAKAEKSGISIGTLRKVYNRGMAAWNSGHRPGTTPQQWGMARVNSYITKGKGTYHGADKDLREETVQESGGTAVWKSGCCHVEKYGDDAFALYVNDKKHKFYTSLKDAKAASVEFNEQLEEKEVPKDPESGLPKKYVAGLSTSTAKARAAHFDKMDKKSDSDPSAYEPAPGDATAKTKTSKHTLKYREMYGESIDEEILEACWVGYKQVGVKKKGNRMVPNCVAEDVDYMFHPLIEAVNAIDSGEYDYEGQMARLQLQTICRNSKDLVDMLSDDENMPEWVQSKITLAQDYISSVRDYLQSKKELGENLEEQFDIIEEVVGELSAEYGIDSDVIWENFEDFTDEELLEYAVDSKGHKSSTGGLTQKGRDAYNAKGGNLQAPVTTPPSKLKPGSKAANRRKSFCARMGGMEGAMKKPNGEPTRKALALRKWNC